MPKPINALTIRNAPLQHGEGFLLHRHPHLDHEDGPDCWCCPMAWTFAEAKTLPLTEINRQLDEFYAVH